MEFFILLATPRIEAAKFSETLVIICQYTVPHLREEMNRFIPLFADHIKVTSYCAR
jgi:hypothetical protein